jgi:hypothetical protein
LPGSFLACLHTMDDVVVELYPYVLTARSTSVSAWAAT